MTVSVSLVAVDLERTWSRLYQTWRSSFSQATTFKNWWVPTIDLRSCTIIHPSLSVKAGFRWIVIMWLFLVLNRVIWILLRLWNHWTSSGTGWRNVFYTLYCVLMFNLEIKWAVFLFYSLLRNPVTNKKHYRLYVINKIPQIRVLDFQKVKLKVWVCY